MPAVNPKILVWARESAGLTIHKAAAKVRIHDARGVKAADRLSALERGEAEPTESVLKRMARQYHRPLLVFFLNSPPRPEEHGPEVQRPHGGPLSRTDALVAALVRNLQCRHGMLRSALESEGEARHLPFVGSLRTGSASESFSEAVACAPEGDRLVKHAVTRLGEVLGNLAVAQYYDERDADDAFQLLRLRAEDAGIFVVLKGDLGSHHTAVDVDAFRGLALADEVAPFAAVNHYACRSTWSFALLRELTHLLLGRSAVSAAMADSEIERFCDRVASGWLLPTRILDEIRIDEEAGLDEQSRRIEDFARSRNLNPSMVADRLRHANRISRPAHERCHTELGTQRVRSLDTRSRSARGSCGGRGYYAVHRYRVGRGVLDVTRRMLNHGALSTTKAARVLGVKPRSVGAMLRPA